MAARSLLNRALVATIGIAILTVAPAAAQSSGGCDLIPGAETCQGGGQGGGSGGAEDPDAGLGEFGWGPVEPLLTVCGTDPLRPQYLQRLVWSTGPLAGTYVTADDFAGSWGPGDAVPGGPAGAVFAADGFVYRWICTDPGIAADVWAETTERMSPVGVVKNPDVSGLTGLETWVWLGTDPTVAPFRLAWTDPATGFGWVLEAWAWTATLSWSFGDGTAATLAAAGLDDARAVAGSESDPAATHTYRTSSAGAGLADGYPLTVTAVWVGEYRWSADGGTTWSLPVPMSGSFTDTATITYPVLQVRSALITP